MIKLPKTPNLTELAYLSVKQHLLHGTLSEGSRLTEESLARQLGISKSPVREALNRLESEGLVRIESRRGAHVRIFTHKEIQDLYELRVLLEMHAVETAHMTPAILAELERSIERTVENLAAGDKLKHIDEDIRFHNIIATATENEELVRLLENVQQKSLLCRFKTWRLSASTAPLSHQRILEALRVDDREEAKRAMREHILFVRDRLLAAMQDGQTLAGEPVAVG